MKRVFFTLLFAVVANAIYAQEPRPNWVEEPPHPPKGANFIYVYGMGVGVTEKDAELAAWKNALYKSFQGSGLVGITNQTKTLDDVFSMNDLETKIPTHVLPRHFVCQTPQILLSDNKVKVYILLKVKLDGSKPDDFYDKKTKISCKSQDFDNKLAEWNKVQLRERDKAKYTNLTAAKIAVAKIDVGKGINWESSNNLCKNFILGGDTDWRLPTIEELGTIFSNKDEIGGFSDSEYWSSTQGSSGSRRKTMSMKNGNISDTYSSELNSCRCVRTLR